MRYQILILTTILSFSIIFTACDGAQTPATNANANQTNANVNAANTNTNSTLSTSKTPEEATVNQGETVAPVVKMYCDAMTKKDDAMIRKVYSQATLKTLEEDMKSENKKSLIEFLSEIDKVSNKVCEVRNEKVTGETAVAEVRTESYPNGIKIKFVKESGEWKMTNESPDFDAVKKSASETNTAK